MMNSFFCRLTGGHKYADTNLKTELSPDSNKVWLSNHCIKCGTRYFCLMDTDHIIKDSKRSDNNAE